MEHNCISLIFPTNGIYDEHHIDLLVLQYILNTRLFINIRDKLGLVYNITVSLNDYIEGGFFSINYYTDKTRTHKCLKAIKLELSKIIKNGFAVDEYKRAIINLKSQLIMSMERTDDMTDFYGSQMTIYPEIYSFADIIHKIEATTPPKINKLSASLLTNFKTIIYGEVSQL
jgi:predicted Zn-dependent peptidase